MNATERQISDAAMSRKQLAGEACAFCEKAWPRPTVTIGFWADRRTALVCQECADGTEVEQ